MTGLLSKLQPLISAPGLAELGPRARPGTQSSKEIQNRLQALLASEPVSETRHPLILGALLLWHDHLDEAHNIAQAIDNPDGSFLHAIMHRREPDASNSKYWWRRVGPHPSFALLGRKSSAYLSGQDPLATRLLPKGEWDPFAFVDVCQPVMESRSAGEPGLKKTLQQLQLFELEAFLEQQCRPF